MCHQNYKKIEIQPALVRLESPSASPSGVCGTKCAIKVSQLKNFKSDKTFISSLSSSFMDLLIK